MDLNESEAKKQYDEAVAKFEEARKVWMNVEIGGGTTYEEHEKQYETWVHARAAFHEAEALYYSLIASGEEEEQKS